MILLKKGLLVLFIFLYFLSVISAQISWSVAYDNAKALVNKMSLEEKIKIMTGKSFTYSDCAGNTYATQHFPSLCLQDGPLGMRAAHNVTLGVAGINAAASFDKQGILQRGIYMGKEFKGKGVHVQLGPGMNFMRSPQNGRGWESFGEDPFLSGVAAAETIKGVQSQGVISTAKHFILNEQELNRFSESSDVDDRTLHEVYLWPFARSVEAGLGAVMCSYNKINGTNACENDHVLNKILKQELNFKGFVMTDWWAARSTVQSANSGLDMEMPGNIDINNPDSGSYFGANLTSAVKDHQVNEARINDMAERIVATWYKMGQDKNFPGVKINNLKPNKAPFVNVKADHSKYVRSLGAASVVLLSNKENILPLSKNTKSISIIGSDAFNSPLIYNETVCPYNQCAPGTLVQGWGSGTVTFPSHIISPFDGIKERAGNNTKVTGTSTNWDLEKVEQIAKESDIAIVFSNSDSGEDINTGHGDRINLTLWNNGDNLIERVANSNKNTIVVIHSVGAVLMPWIDHPNIKAIVWPGLPGEQSGNSLADVLYGDVNPSGRLPYTIAKKLEDYVTAPSPDDHIVYSEKLNIGYRWFDAKNIEPLFPFGYGLSYTHFSYSHLDVVVSAKKEEVHAQIRVKNDGGIDGAEVVQLYLSFPNHVGEPPKILRGFEKVFIKSGRQSTVQFELGKTELSIWDVVSQSWVIPQGEFRIHIGASSRDIRQSSAFIL
ncbi:beta-glucosidase [Cunninghamella echinulata]|nr:beta-glucosidase [Cunninghamella echinulata]